MRLPGEGVLLERCAGVVRGRSILREAGFIKFKYPILF